MPVTVAVPTVVPPVLQVLGALLWGPNTLNVIVPPAPLPAPDSVAVIELAGIAVLVGSVVGPLAELLVWLWTTTVLVNELGAVHDEWYSAVMRYL